MSNPLFPSDVIESPRFLYRVQNKTTCDLTFQNRVALQPGGFTVNERLTDGERTVNEHFQFNKHPRFKVKVFGKRLLNPG